MAAYHWVYDSRHLQADCQERGSTPETLHSVIEYGLRLSFPLLFFLLFFRVTYFQQCGENCICAMVHARSQLDVIFLRAVNYCCFYPYFHHENVWRQLEQNIMKFKRLLIGISVNFSD